MNDMICGKNAVFEALKTDRVLKLLVTEQIFKQNVALIKNHPHEIVAKSLLDKMTANALHQGIVALIKPYSLYPIEDLIKKDHGFIIVLDNLSDPRNLGAIMRTADCVNADGIVYKKHNSVKLNTTVAKVSSGAIEYVKVTEVTNIVSTLKMLKKANYWIVGTAMRGDRLYDELDYDGNIALVIGSEGKGISRLVKEECDFLVRIPMMGHAESLNASVAAGVLMYEVFKQRRKRQ